MQHPWLKASSVWWFLSVLASAIHTTDYLYTITALSPIVAAAVGAYLSWRLRQVHTIVNSQRTALEARIDQLEATIKDSNKDVPATTRETGHP